MTDRFPDPDRQAAGECVRTEVSRRDATDSRESRALASDSVKEPSMERSLAGLTPLWIRHLEGGNGDPSAIDEIAMSDPSIALRLLSIANSPCYGLRGTVSTLPHAIALLGRKTLRKLMCGSLLSMRADDDGRFATSAEGGPAWLRRLVTAHLARELAARGRAEIADEAYAVALLQDTPRSAGPLDESSPADVEAPSPEADASRIPRNFPRRIRAALAILARQRDRRILSGERPGPEAPDESATDPPALEGDSTRTAPRARELAFLVEGATRLVARAANGSQGGRPSFDAALAAGFEELGIPTLEVDDLVWRARNTALEIARRGGTDASDFEALEAWVRESHEIEIDPSGFGLVPAPTAGLRLVSRATRELRRMDSWPGVLDAVLHLLPHELGFDRAVWFERHPGGRSVVVRSARDETHLAWGLEGTELALGDGARSLSNVIRSREGVLARDRSIDGRILGPFEVSEMALAPVIVKRQVAGILGVDRFVRGLPLEESDLVALELVGGKVGLVLENLALENQGRELRRIAEKDALTGINNRRYCIELCRREIERARRYGAPLSIVMIDIDDFKGFNDTYGHAAGDRVLREIAGLLESNSRSTDVIGRLGGDEFLVALPQIGKEKARTYAERVRERAFDLGASIRETYPKCPLAISLGVATWTRGSRIDDVIAAADKALYTAKDRGRNQVCTTD